ncbi:unnamed protein product [Protopolystoma xenopodis]|uniref:Uncharacterized protein n=1 Tax=Protopolystoma xenopodis TaxID=117903 RepID=A0A448X530_9PLAT|nr:unnamed protein product [Protopolystoma xenopodis]
MLNPTNLYFVTSLPALFLQNTPSSANHSQRESTLIPFHMTSMQKTHIYTTARGCVNSGLMRFGSLERLATSWPDWKLKPPQLRHMATPDWHLPRKPDARPPTTQQQPLHTLCQENVMKWPGNCHRLGSFVPEIAGCQGQKMERLREMTMAIESTQPKYAQTNLPN